MTLAIDCPTPISTGVFVYIWKFLKKLKMIKFVRRRPTHHTTYSRKKGMVMLPHAMIGSKVKIMSEGEFNTIKRTIKQLRHKLWRVKEVVYVKP